MEKLLQLIREELVNRRGSLITVSKESGVKYDTLIRIRDGSGYEPGFSKVAKLAEYFKIKITLAGR